MALCTLTGDRANYFGLVFASAGEAHQRLSAIGRDTLKTGETGMSDITQAQNAVVARILEGDGTASHRDAICACAECRRANHADHR